MYKKVDFDLGVATIDGKTIGMEKDNFNGTIVIEGKDGTILFAEYGTLVDEEFYPFCRTFNCMNCNRRNSPNCRYNRLTNKNDWILRKNGLTLSEPHRDAMGLLYNMI